EQRHTKAEILEAYLNEIYLGQRGKSSVSGVGEAARLYFGKEIGQLSLGENALLAGMIRSPNQYSPFRSKESAKGRRDFVLAKLFAAKRITQAEYAKARVEPIFTPTRASQVVHAPYFIDFVRRQLKALYPDDVLQSEGLRIFTTLDMTAQLEAERAVREGLDRLETQYAKSLPADHAGQLQGALIGLQPQTGYIRALVGGRSFDDTKFNRVVQAKRQPGSTFKPFVYLTAFDPARSKVPFAPSSYIDDTAFTVRAGDKEWSPANYDKAEHGRVTLQTALVQSYNIATAKVAMEAGLEAVAQTARDAGITSEVQAVPSLALGAFEVTPLEMAAAYTIFANNGIRAEPLSVMYVVTKDGQVVEKKSIEMERRFAPGPVYLTTLTMKEVFDRGTAQSARALGFKGIAAGKTGTTSSYRDAWFVGFTPELLALTWVGYDDNSVLNMSGARAALPIRVEFMR
ncbi:MAG: transglycosylase domain-containing protein, partial [Deltaproteobacteria bacterium]|nr:transglycosylase domain-containing protein [Deltaproteobacteria bacterium]